MLWRRGLAPPRSGLCPGLPVGGEQGSECGKAPGSELREGWESQECEFGRGGGLLRVGLSLSSCRVCKVFVSRGSDMYSF